MSRDLRSPILGVTSGLDSSRDEQEEVQDLTSLFEGNHKSESRVRRLSSIKSCFLCINFTPTLTEYLERKEFLCRYFCVNEAKKM